MKFKRVYMYVNKPYIIIDKKNIYFNFINVFLAI